VRLLEIASAPSRRGDGGGRNIFAGSVNDNVVLSFLGGTASAGKKLPWRRIRTNRVTSPRSDSAAKCYAVTGVIHRRNPSRAPLRAQTSSDGTSWERASDCGSQRRTASVNGARPIAGNLPGAMPGEYAKACDVVNVRCGSSILKRQIAYTDCLPMRHNS
jgi:hypothetical protein